MHMISTTYPHLGLANVTDKHKLSLDKITLTISRSQPHKSIAISPIGEMRDGHPLDKREHQLPP